MTLAGAVCDSMVSEATQDWRSRGEERENKHLEKMRLPILSIDDTKYIFDFQTNIKLACMLKFK